MSYMDLRAKAQIKRDEGRRLKPYKCTEGYWTIGYGRNLDVNGITPEEADHIFNNDYDRARDIATLFPCWTTLNGPRQAVLVNMIFQMGAKGVMKFRLMQKALDERDWSRAAEEMLDSKWHRQTPERAERLAIQMRTGKWVD